MAFDAGRVVEALDWDFRPYLDAHGTVPEPSDDEIEKMNAGLRDATVRVTGADFDPTDRAAAMRVMSKLSEQDLSRMKDAYLDAVAVVTKQSPSRDVLAQVPGRVRTRFIRWLSTELNSPEG